MNREVPSKNRCRTEKGDIEVEIPAGMRDGDTITFAGEGNQKDDQIPGDLILKVVYNKKSRN